jgi:hypothetical protein
MTAFLREHTPSKPLLTLVGWTIVIVCVVYCSLTFGEYWDGPRGESGCPKGTYDGLLVWLTGIVVLALVFGFVTNAWVVVVLGLSSLPVSLITAVVPAFSACGTDSPPAWFSAIGFASSTLFGGFLLAAPILLFRRGLGRKPR